MPAWNPAQYLKFVGERTRPSLDLCFRIPLEAPGRILDVGCGPGNSTRVLRERWPSAHILGIDSSPEMIAEAAKTYPQGTWRVADATAFQGDPMFDVVFANAVLQWLPGHEDLVPRLLGMTTPGGYLAVQVPSDPDAPIRRAMLTASRQSRFRGALDGAEGSLTFHDARFYYDLLVPIASQLDLWETTYFHQMESHQALVDWFESTSMRPFLERLPDPDDQTAFKDEVLAACKNEYPCTADGKVLLPFQRLFFMARRVVSPTFDIGKVFPVIDVDVVDPPSLQ